MSRTLGVALRVAIAEGPAAARDRLLDRVDEWRRRHAFARARAGRRFAAPVLNVLSTRPARRLGGLLIQLLRRLEREAEQRPYALLHPDAGGYRLERRDGGQRDALTIAGPGLNSSPTLTDPGFESALLRAAEASGTTVVHVEGLAGIPPASLLALRDQGLTVVLSLHDFAPFCPRPDLLARPAWTFCGYCVDLDRCRDCLAHDWSLAPDFQRRYRDTGAELLRRARAVVYPSDYLRTKLAELVPGLEAAAQRVIAPASVPATPPRVRPPGPRPHVAFVGAVHVRKGARLFEELVRRARTERPGLRWSIFGGGEPDLVRRLSRLPGVSVRGYYRPGALPALLRAHGVDVALLLSIVPESYGLTLDECREAGVPVVAFDHGAVGERVSAGGGGARVPLAEGSAGVMGALGDVLDGRRLVGPRVDHGASPDPATAHLALYRELGLF